MCVCVCVCLYPLSFNWGGALPCRPVSPVGCGSIQQVLTQNAATVFGSLHAALHIFLFHFAHLQHFCSQECCSFMSVILLLWLFCPLLHCDSKAPFNDPKKKEKKHTIEIQLCSYIPQIHVIIPHSPSQRLLNITLRTAGRVSPWISVLMADWCSVSSKWGLVSRVML